jgi:hypothetical protein
MENNQWVLNQIELLLKTEPRYQQRAFYRGLAQMVKEQQKRIEQSQGELDGRLWSPAKW